MTTLNDIKERIKERADLASHISKDTKLFKSGSGFKACCPLPGHTEKTPSFNINTRDNYFFCYGCQRGGDIFTYLELTRGLPFMDALKELAEQYHIELPKTSEKGDFKAPQAREQSLELMERATKYFESMLHKGATPGAIAAQKYLASRNYTLEDAAKFRLGWAPEFGNKLAGNLLTLKKSKLGQDLGLLSRGRDNDDFFKGRLMIPIEDHRGRVVAFSGRAIGIRDNEGPKYKNSPETLVFKKKEVLYGLSRALKGARELGWLTVVEGFFDAWAFERLEIPSVAVMGVALTTEHLEKLGRICKQLVLVMDTDRAGIESTKRSLPLLYAQGFEVKVFADLGGKDPDEWLAEFKGSKEEVTRRLQKAPEGMEWWASQVIAESRDKNLNPLQIVHRLEELWPAMQSPAHRRFWLKAIAPNIGLSEAQLSAHFAKIPLTGPVPQKNTEDSPPEMEDDDYFPPSAADPNDYILQEIVALLIAHGAAWEKIHEERDGSLLHHAFEGTPLELPFARSLQGGEFKPKALVEALKKAGLELYVALASITENQEGPSGRDHRKLLRDLCLQFVSIRKNAHIKRLVIELKKSPDEAKSAQILQAIQTARKEVEELKKFSFSL
ncbi:MAG: DNA primase [Bdellovibrionota bacterium]